MNFINNIKRAFQWLDNNSTDNFVYVSSLDKKPYYEVSGYFIPTLLNYGFKKKAESFASYLASIQNKYGHWTPAIVFDTAQIIDGLSEFKDRYKNQIEKAVQWILSQFKDNKFIDPYNGVISDHIYLRVIYCLSKSGVNIRPQIDKMIQSYYVSDLFKFTTLSHFYAYGFEGTARLNLDCKNFIEEISRFEYLPEKPNLTSYCYTGLSQIALSLFLAGQYEKGMKYLEFVSKFQNHSGGFFGSNGNYFPQAEISWAVKFYLDAFLEGQRLWFKNHINIFATKFEYGEKDERFLFIKNNVKESDNVLEVGCGKGRYINNLKCDRYACDIADASSYVDANFKIGSCLRLPYEDQIFNVVFASEVFEHSIFVDNAIQECLRVLRPGGKLLIIDKDDQMDFAGLHFGEKWLNFESIRKNYGAEITKIRQFSVPFYAAKISK